MGDAKIGATHVCFVDMPFGKKPDPATGVTIQFDEIYEEGIRPAIEAAGLTPVRGDQEKTGGVIHRAMFARLLMSEFVLADMTTANANVFYELGVRHATRPYTTIPIFATTTHIPFDVNMVRAIPYELENGRLTAASARSLQEAIQARIRNALEGPVSKDSPIFDMFGDLRPLEITHELTDVFQDRIQLSEAFASAIDEADDGDDSQAALRALQDSFDDLKAQEDGILMRLLLAYRKHSAWEAMIELYDGASGSFQAGVVPRQQVALALNRRNGPGDRKRATRLIEGVIQESGASAESYGILGRIWKDRYKEALEAEDPRAEGFLDLAIGAYTQGFEAEPADYYPGVNAINLLMQKSGPEAQAEADRLMPLVSFAVARRGGASSDDYWDVVTALELAAIAGDTAVVRATLGRALALASEGWMAETTAANLELILEKRRNTHDAETVEALEQAVGALRAQAADL